MQIHRFILGSKSPYRKALLEAAGLPCVTVEAIVNEAAIVEATPRLTALARAQAKALDVARRCVPGDLVLGADQVLGFKGAIFDKSPTENAARLRLQELQGQTHILHTAMVLVLVSESVHSGQEGAGSGLTVLSSHCIDTPMKMRSLKESEIDAYLKTGEWQGSVGCYKYELLGIQLFDGLSDQHPLSPMDDLSVNTSVDQSAVVGLPLRPLFDQLRRIGVNPLLSPKGPWTYRQSGAKGGEL